MKKFLALSLISASALFGAENAPKMGIVNFASCVTDSKFGKQEQASLEALKTQMTSLVENTEKQLREMSDKFNDKDYMDGLSPEAEEELKTKFRSLSEEMNRYQQQYYQVLNQANFKMLQNVGASINAAAENVAESKSLNMVVNKEACFYYLPSLDVTADVIKEMDKNFDADTKKQAPK